jgi:hypothetical protein
MQRGVYHPQHDRDAIQVNGVACSCSWTYQQKSVTNCLSLTYCFARDQLAHSICHQKTIHQLV